MSLKSFNAEHTDTSHYTVILMTLLSFKVMLGLGNFAFCPIIQVKISGAPITFSCPDCDRRSIYLYSEAMTPHLQLGAVKSKSNRGRSIRSINVLRHYAVTTWEEFCVSRIAWMNQYVFKRWTAVMESCCPSMTLTPT